MRFQSINNPIRSHKPRPIIICRKGWRARIDLRDYASKGLQLYGTVDDINGFDITFLKIWKKTSIRQMKAMRVCGMIDDYIDRLKYHSLNLSLRKSGLPLEINHVNALEAGITSILVYRFCCGLLMVEGRCLGPRGRPLHKEELVKPKESIFSALTGYTHGVLGGS